MEKSTRLTAYNKITIPLSMYGTAWKAEDTGRLVDLAVKTGFTAIDTANQLIHYQETLVGEALQALYQSGIKRDSLFLQTKFTSVNGQDHRTPYDASANLTTQVKQSIDSSLVHLHADYIDSYVLHGPHTRQGLGPSDWEVWAAIEELYKIGKARMIGISNVTAEQLTQLCAQSKNKPMVVQNRCYASMGWDQEVREICQAHNIIYQGFSLLTANGKALLNHSVRSIADRLGATVAQVIFCFTRQIGMLPLTGTTNVQHMKEDLASESLILTTEDIKTIETIAL